MFEKRKRTTPEEACTDTWLKMGSMVVLSSRGTLSAARHTVDRDIPSVELKSHMSQATPSTTWRPRQTPLAKPSNGPMYWAWWLGLQMAFCPTSVVMFRLSPLLLSDKMSYTKVEVSGPANSKVRWSTHRCLWATSS